MNQKSETFYAGTYEKNEVFDKVIEILLNRRVRTYCDLTKDNETENAKDAAEAIANCKTAIFCLTKQGIDSLAFRNKINFALALGKSIVCINADGCTLANGLDMQLANADFVKCESAEQIVDDLLNGGKITQDMIGEPLQIKKKSAKKTRLGAIAIMVITTILIFIACAGVVVWQRTSPKYLLKDVDGAEYLCVSQFNDDALAYLEGMHIGRLDMSNGNFNDVSALALAYVKEIDVSGNKNIASLWPLIQCEGLEKVIIDRSMLRFASELYRAGITVEVKGVEISE